jgi:type VI protein secretion system component Hcp
MHERAASPKHREMNMTQLNKEIRELSIDEISDQELDTIVGGSDAGAGKVTFNPFSITRHVDKASPVLFL